MVDDISRTGILISKRVFFTVDNIMYRDFHMLHLSQAGSVSCARLRLAHDTLPAWLRCNMWKSLYIIYYTILMILIHHYSDQKRVQLQITFIDVIVTAMIIIEFKVISRILITIWNFFTQSRRWVRRWDDACRRGELIA